MKSNQPHCQINTLRSLWNHKLKTWSHQYMELNLPALPSVGNLQPLPARMTRQPISNVMFHAKTWSASQITQNMPDWIDLNHKSETYCKHDLSNRHAAFIVEPHTENLLTPKHGMKPAFPSNETCVTKHDQSQITNKNMPRYIDLNKWKTCSLLFLIYSTRTLKTAISSVKNNQEPAASSCSSSSDDFLAGHTHTPPSNLLPFHRWWLPCLT